MDYGETARLTLAAKASDATPEDQLSLARHLLENNLAAEALPYLARVSELLPSPEIAALAGSVAVKVGDLKQARRHFELQLKCDPDTAEAHASLGIVGAAMNCWKDAARHFGSAVEKKPDDADWQNDLGVALFNIKDSTGAENAFVKARALRPRDMDSTVNLADLYESLERPEDAFRTLADHLRYDPGNVVLRQRKDRLFSTLPESFKTGWRESPLDSSVYDDEYFETHLGTALNAEHWKTYRGRTLDSRFDAVVGLCSAGPDDEVLDIGCGRGELAYYFSGRCRHVVALDYSEPAVRLTREVCADRSNVDTIRLDAKEIDYDARFGLIVMTDVVEHLHRWELEDVLRRCQKALKPGGQIVIHTPVIGEIPLGNGPDAHTHVVAKELYDFPVHVNLMTNDELKGIVKASGFVLGQVKFDGKIVLEARKPDPVPVPERIRSAAVSGRLTGQRILICASDDAFLGDIRSHLAADNEIHDFGGGSVALLEREMRWADIAWFEWCDDFLAMATKMTKQCRIVCRLHSYEAFTNNPEQVDWSKVDGLMFVNDSVRELLSGRIPSTLRTAIIPNGVDLEKFPFPEAKTYGKRVAFAGYLNYKKNPGFMLAIAEAIYRYDSEFTFHIAGKYQGAHIQVFLEHMLPKMPFKVTFDGWVDDMSAWLEDKDYILSTSYFESFHYSVAESIARGVLPLVYNWRGSENCYPDSVRFNTMEECVQLLDGYRKDPDPLKRALKLRNDLARRFGVKPQLEATDLFLSSVMSATAEPAGAPSEAEPFDARSYWERRLSSHFNEQGVGYFGMGEEYNRFMYRLRAWRLKDRLARLGIDPSGARILDVGSGTGFYLDFWKTYSPSCLEGMDLTETASMRLRKKYPDLSIHHADISARSLNIEGPFDIVSAFDMLFHIIDDNAFAAALTNLSNLLNENGHLILTVGYSKKVLPQTSDHYRARSESEYRRHFDRLGLQVVTAEPMFVTMNAPLDASRVKDPSLRALYDELWALTQSLFSDPKMTHRHKEQMSHLACLHEQIHLLSNVDSPSAKLVIVRKGTAGA